MCGGAERGEKQGGEVVTSADGAKRRKTHCWAPGATGVGNQVQGVSAVTVEAIQRKVSELKQAQLELQELRRLCRKDLVKANWLYMQELRRYRQTSSDGCN